MDYKTFRIHLRRADLTNKEFAELVKLNAKSITNYKQANEVPVHWAIVALLMGEMAVGGLDFRQSLSKMEIEPNKVRGGAAKGRWGGSPQFDFPGMME